MLRFADFELMKTLKVYISDDRPLLFLAIDQNGFRYIALLSEVDEVTNDETWLYLPVTERRLKELEDSQMSVRKAFLIPECQFIYKIKPFNKEVDYIHCSSIKDDWLPKQTIFLNGINTASKV